MHVRMAACTVVHDYLNIPMEEEEEEVQTQCMYSTSGWERALRLVELLWGVPTILITKMLFVYGIITVWYGLGFRGSTLWKLRYRSFNSRNE